MRGSTSLIGLVRVVALSLVVWSPEVPLFGGEVSVVTTNWAERWITNLVEVRMPANRFVNDYHTNWVTQLRTNVVDVYATNRVTRIVTNRVVVDALRTNIVVAYQTNWHTKTLTNRVAVNVLRTNLVQQFETNWSTLNLTNWTTVVMFKTNWIAQPVTNIVQVAVPARPTAPEALPREVSQPKEARSVAVTPVLATGWAGPLAIEAARTSRPVLNDLVEVQLKARWTGNTAAPMQVQNWRVERQDGAILLFGQDQEFKRQLPVGSYKVEAKLKAEGDDPPLLARGTLSVTLHEVTIQPRLLVKK
jgi:hypothetical protein